MMMKSAMQMSRWVTKFLCEQDGAASSEYAVLLAIITSAAIVTIAVLGYHVAGTATSVSAGLPGGSAQQFIGPTSVMQSHVTSTIP